MLVVADSSPLNILIRVGCVGVLPALFDSVAIPTQVRDELSNDRTPADVRGFILHPPDWLRVLVARQIEPIASVDAGEEAAIALTREIGADALLIDDAAGRRAAMERGLAVIGTVGILERASERDIIRLADVVPALLKSDFRVSIKLLTDAVERDADRRRSRS